ncbi:hypothetical protein N0M98_15765 [Paenibacillus doosanensis]|uniref:Uncharacterized protein n=1 Tax=Paenibacillus konkukensis TaxID=2020716 RepID=A0ABY4RIU8_9BACL|nr:MULTISPECIES: hypothetical protein [Paenibacillus]MCS7461610.1 hypothetical protein [Paenibacillus doosanensis]UQZ82035.1 hypothetical protein SK3146_01192 [Paenibacillus konkukensis]
MEFDYCQMEADSSGDTLLIDIGCKFTDEPDELYVVQLKGHKDGRLEELRLVFNRMDCKYNFKPEEKAAVLQYVGEALDSSEYANWFQGGLTLIDE